MRIRTLKELFVEATGTEIAEAALVLPIMFLVLLGIYYFGLALSTYETINHAAMEAARIAAMDICATCTKSTANTELAGNAAQQVMQAAALDPTKSQELTQTVTACASGPTPPPCLDPSSFGGPKMCIYYNVVLNTVSGPQGPQACGVYVSLQYPYQFFLPFSSLNQQAILLKARVQFRGEY